MIGFCLNQIKLDKTDYQYITLTQNNLLIAAAMVTDKNILITSTPGPFLKKLADYLIEKNILFTGVVGPSISSETFSRIYSQLTSATYKIGVNQMIFQNSQHKIPKVTDGKAQLAEENHVDLIAQWFLEFQQECLSHDPTTLEKTTILASTKIKNKEVYLWIDYNNNLVSMCCVARPTQNGITINGVYTPRCSRKRGFASAVVSYATQLMLAQGRLFCVLYTDLANPTSNKIYQDIGFKPVASSKHYLIYK